VIALRTGRITAAFITPPRNVRLQRDGFNRIAYSGDYMSTYANGESGLADEKIKTNPTEVQAFVRGTTKALQYSMKNRAETIKIVRGDLGIKDPIPIDQKTLVVPGKEIPPSQVFDFSVLQKAARQTERRTFSAGGGSKCHVVKQPRTRRPFSRPTDPRLIPWHETEI
jgi:hypothetical protein